MESREKRHQEKRDVVVGGKFLEGLFKLERWFYRYKVALVLVAVVAICGFLGYNIGLWYQQKQAEEHYVLYQELLHNAQDATKREMLKSSGSLLYDVLLFTEASKAGDVALFEELQKSQDGFIRMLASYQSASLNRDSTQAYDLENAFEEFLTFQRVYLLLKEDRIEEAHALLARIAIHSPVRGVSRFFEHYGITKVALPLPAPEEQTSTPQNRPQGSVGGVELFSGAKSKE